jgi:hypothetical protein
MGLRLDHRAAVLAGSILGLTSLARAQVPAPAPPTRGPVALHWVRLAGAEDCIAGDALAREVELKLQRQVFPVPRDAEILIEGHVRRGPDGYRAELRMTRADGAALGARTLNSAQGDCRELSETVGVVLAVMIDPDAEGHVRAPEPAPPPKPPAPPKPAAPVFPDANRLLVFARVLLAVVPDAGIGLGAAYERALGVAGGLRVEAVSFLEQRLGDNGSIAGSAQAAMNLNLSYAGLAYCPLWLPFPRLRLSGCAGIELGQLRSQGVNLNEDDRADSMLWVSGSAALRLSVRLVSALELHLGGSFVATGKHEYNVSVREMGSTDSVPTPITDGTNSFGAAFDLGLGARF